MSRLLTIVGAVLALSLAWAGVAFAQTASRVIRQIDQSCANCHRDPGADRAPDVESTNACSDFVTPRLYVVEVCLQTRLLETFVEPP